MLYRSATAAPLLLVSILFFTHSPSRAQEQRSSDGKITVAIPPGWQPFTQVGTEFAYQFPGPDPLIFFMISEKKTPRQVLNDILVSTDNVKTEDFASATGWKGTKVSVKRPLSTPDTFVFQFYYLFSKLGKTYALVFTTGICQASQTPEKMFDAIAVSAHSK